MKQSWYGRYLTDLNVKHKASEQIRNFLISVATDFNSFE